MRLESYVLRDILALDYFFVIEGNSRLTAAGILSQNVNRSLLGKITTAAGQRNRVQNRRRVCKRVRAWLCHLSQDVELLTIDLLDHYRYFWFLQIGLQFVGDVLFEFQRGQAGCLYFPHQGQRNSSVGSHWNGPREILFLPYMDRQNIIISDDKAVVVWLVDRRCHRLGEGRHCGRSRALGARLTCCGRLCPGVTRKEEANQSQA